MPDQGLTNAYLATLASAVIPIVLGSFSSIRLSKRTKRLIREQKGLSKEELEAHEQADEEEPIDRITFDDAWLFPILGSCMLGGLWILIKYIDQVWVNWFLGWYFTLAGVLTMFTTFSTIVEYLTPRSISTRLPEYTLVVADRTSRLMDLKLPLLTLPVAPLALFVPYVYATQGHPWWANNLLAFTFAHSAIALMTLDSFLTGSVLLGGLFLYDCWWVFGSHLVAGSSVMVDVAKGLDAPIKLLFPKDLALSATKGFTMLGLGDIIIPGVFVALALRFDYSLYTRKHPDRPILPSQGFPKPYFYTTLSAYVGGLLTTIGVMHIFQAAQPALLYLSPACVGAVSLAALFRSETATLRAWADGEDDELEDLVLKAKKAGSATPSKPKSVANGVSEKVETLTNNLATGFGEDGDEEMGEVLEMEREEDQVVEVEEEDWQPEIASTPRRAGLRSRNRQ